MKNLGEFIYMKNEFDKEAIVDAICKAYSRGENINLLPVQRKAAASVGQDLDDFSDTDLEDMARMIKRRIRRF